MRVRRVALFKNNATVKWAGLTSQVHTPHTLRGKVATEKNFMWAKNICCPQLATVASAAGLVTGGWGPVAGAYI